MFTLKLRISILLLLLGLLFSLAQPTFEKPAIAGVQKTQASSASEQRAREAKENVLLQQYVDVSLSDPSTRRKFFTDLSGADRSYLWRVHLSFHIASHPELSAEQSQLVLDALAIATPELFSLRNDDPSWRAKVAEPLNGLRERALQLFSKEQAGEILANLGGGPSEIDYLRQYLALAPLDRSARKSFFSNAPAFQKSKIWQAHLAMNLARRSELNARQRAVINEAITIVTPELYETPKNDASWSTKVDEPIRLFAKRALAVFGKEDGAMIFSELGGSAPTLHHARTTLPACDCSHESDWCVYDCWSSNCTSSTWGCGTLGLYACNGLCYWPPMGDGPTRNGL